MASFSNRGLKCSVRCPHGCSNYILIRMLIDLQNYFSSTDWLGEKTKCLSPGSSDWVGSLFSCSVVSNSLRAHGLQHTRLPGPLLAPGVCSNSCPPSQ